MLYVFFSVIPRRLNFICRRFGTLCLFHLHRLIGDEWQNSRIVWVANGRRFGSKITCVNSKEGDGIATPTPSPSLLLAQVIFEPSLLPLATETILEFCHSSPISLWRLNRESVPKRRAYKIQTPGNYPKENIQLNLTCLRLFYRRNNKWTHVSKVMSASSVSYYSNSQRYFY